jgi:hypothetical protein
VPSKSKSPKKQKLPKKKCCISSSRCKRCPIRMLRDGTLPDGYTVKKRKLVTVSAAASVPPKKVKQGKKKRKDKRVEPIAA